MKDAAELIARLRAVRVNWLAKVAEWRAIAPGVWTDEYISRITPRLEDEAADHIETLEARVATLSAALAFADGQSAKVEALLEPHITWECASDGCGKPATVRFDCGGVGSYYCHACYVRIQAIPAARETSR